MSEAFPEIPKIQFEGQSSKNPLSFKHYNADEAPELVQFALNEGLDISFIEEMPLGRISGHGRADELQPGGP